MLKNELVKSYDSHWLALVRTHLLPYRLCNKRVKDSKEYKASINVAFHITGQRNIEYLSTRYKMHNFLSALLNTAVIFKNCAACYESVPLWY